MGAVVLTLAIGLLVIRQIWWSSPVYQIPRLIGWYVIGRTGVCSLGQVLESRNVLLAQGERIGELTRNSRMVEESPDGLQRWVTPRGTFWAPRGTSLEFVLAEQRRRPYDPGSGFGIHSGDIVLDCGANVGAYTREALDEGAGLVVAIEPVPPNFECLRRTFAKEIEAGRVIVYPKGVWDKQGTLPMWIYPNSVLDSFMMKDRYESEARPRQIQLPLTTIDHLMTELKLPRVDFLKMDIEGAEANALTGARETLAKYKPRMAIATENLVEQQRTIPALVAKLGLGYRARAGCCMSFRRDIRPEVFFFY